MAMGKCYIVGAGEFFLDTPPENGDFIIAADGGYDSLAAAKIVPNILIGDMDSRTVGKIPESIEVITYPVEKDETDMHLSYLEGARRGFTDFVIVGGTGGREDHTLANYALLLYMSERGHRGELIGRESNATVIKDGALQLFGKAGSRVSVFAIGGAAEGVSIEGLKYGACSINLSQSMPLGVSNSLTDKAGVVSVENGALLVIYEKGIDKR